MTSTYERRLRKLEANHQPEGSSVVVLGLPGRPDPTPEEIAQADHVLQVVFISAKGERPVEGGSHARH